MGKLAEQKEKKRKKMGRGELESAIHSEPVKMAIQSEPGKMARPLHIV